MLVSDGKRRVPTIQKESGLDYLRELQTHWPVGSTPSHQIEKPDAPITWVATSIDFDPDVISAYKSAMLGLSLEFPAAISTVPGSRNEFDLAAAKVTFEHLQAIGIPILLNSDFWRYLAVDVLFEVVIWRIPDSGTDSWPSNFGVGATWTRCYPYKAFLRGHLISEVQSQNLPWTDVADVDFFDSHLFGRRNGQIPSVASALNSIRTTLTSSRALDPYATTAGRLRASHVTEVLSADEVKTAILRYTEKS